MWKIEHIRNIGTIAHIDHGKTTLSDNLLAGAGVISEQLAGKQLFMDYDELEQTRGITINAANASMVHTYNDKEYLINLIDTPGHVDFGGDVTRALRALDGAILVVCGVEGVMPQTETVIRQAMKERVKPILFINKVDRLINELKINSNEMQKRFAKIITEVNKLINKYAPPEFRDKWLVDATKGSVIFGSAYHKWATSVSYMAKKGIGFKQIYDACVNNQQNELAEKAQLHEVILDSIVNNLPNPIEAQKYRIPVIWHGEIDTREGREMMNCNGSDSASLAIAITKIIIDKHAGEVAVGRIYSGRISKGKEVIIVGIPKTYRVQTVSVCVGPDRVPLEALSAGNIVALTGIEDVYAGATIASENITPFEKIVHYSEPVVTVAVEPKHPQDLVKLIDVLKKLVKADPSLTAEINQETGEYLLSGMGELHLEIAEYRITHDYSTQVNVSTPIVVYRERTENKGGVFEGVSPNRHNRFYFEVEPLEEKVLNAILSGEIKVGEKIKDKKELARKLVELGMNKAEAKGIEAIADTNILVDLTKGQQYLHETIELIIQGFREAMKKGPLTQEKVRGMKIKFVDTKLHEDSIHRGPAQVIPAVKNAIYGAMCQGNVLLYEPRQKVFINVPQELLGAVTHEMQKRKARIETITQDGDNVNVVCNAAVANMFGFAAAIRSATSGKTLWTTEFVGFEKVPKDTMSEVIKKIRERKGLSAEIPTENSFMP